MSQCGTTSTNTETSTSMSTDTETCTFHPWSRLGEDLAEEVITFLSYQNLLSYHQTSRHAQHVQTKTFSSVWQQQCEQIWLTCTLDDQPSWYSRFHQLRHDIGEQFIHHYARVGTCWKRLYDWVNQHAPVIARTLTPPGVSGVPLNVLTNAYHTGLSHPQHINFPMDLLCWYRIRDGQQNIETSSATGLLGGFSFYQFECDLHLTTFERLSSATFYIAQHHQRVLIPITSSTSEVAFFLNNHGEIIRLYADRQHPGFIVANSFIEWMETYVNRLYAGHHLVHPETGICRFPSGPNAPWDSDTTTEGIRIQVAVLFVPEHSIPSTSVQQITRLSHRTSSARYFFTYKVRITFVDPHSNMTGRLTTRTWIIKDGRGHTERVHGPGVIGLYPEVYYGMETFEYESCTPMEHKQPGEMGGSFHFEIDGREQELEAIITPFALNMETNYN